MCKGCPSLPRVLLSPTDSTWTARLFWWERWGICSSLAGRAGAHKEWPPTAAIGLWEGFSICINLWGHRQSITTATQSQLSLCVRAHTHSHTYAKQSTAKTQTKTWKMNLFCFTLVRENFLVCSFIYSDSMDSVFISYSRRLTEMRVWYLMIWIDSRWRCMPYQIELIICVSAGRRTKLDSWFHWFCFNLICNLTFV